MEINLTGYDFKKAPTGDTPWEQRKFYTVVKELVGSVLLSLTAP